MRAYQTKIPEHLRRKALDKFSRLVIHRVDCWLWKNKPNRYGYNVLQIWDKKINSQFRMMAHRFIYIATYGEIVDPFMHVCHKCDNTLCVNPGHLFLGTAKDNQTDAKAKGRRMQGKNHWATKVNESKILEIQRLLGRGYTQADVAKKIGLAQSLVSKIKRGKHLLQQSDRETN